jgi:hypothetical protein
VSSNSATEIGATLRFSNSSSGRQRSFTLRVSRSSFATMTPLDLAAVYQFHEPLQPWPVEALGRFASVHNDVDQFGPLHVAMARILAT